MLEDWFYANLIGFRCSETLIYNLIRLKAKSTETCSFSLGWMSTGGISHWLVMFLRLHVHKLHVNLSLGAFGFFLLELPRLGELQPPSPHFCCILQFPAAAVNVGRVFMVH